MRLIEIILVGAESIDDREKYADLEGRELRELLSLASELTAAHLLVGMVIRASQIDFFDELRVVQHVDEGVEVGERNGRVIHELYE